MAEQLFMASLPEGWEFNYERMMLAGEVSYKAVAETFERFRDSGLVEWSVFRPVYLINKYLLDRAYGGPEEGGWYNDTGKFIEEIGRAETFEKVDELREALRLPWRPLRLRISPCSLPESTSASPWIRSEFIASL